MIVKWSKGSGKLIDIPSLNTNTITNKYCIAMHKNKDKICADCYSWSALSSYRKTCQNAWERNSQALQKKTAHIHLVNADLNVARFSSHGELINLNHMNHLIDICNKQPDVIFSLWTKRNNIVNKALTLQDKPKNLILIYSNAIVDSTIKVPEHFDKVFNVISKDDKKINCTGKCKDCMLCYSMNNTKQIYEKKK